jgi:hypothetical protein
MAHLTLPPMALDGSSEPLAHHDCSVGTLIITHKMHHEAA